jgi:hypothetical protein
MIILKNLDKLAEKMSHSYELQWDHLDTQFGRNLLEDTYSDALKLIPEIEKYVMEKYADKDFDWNVEDYTPGNNPFTDDEDEVDELAAITPENASTFFDMLTDMKVSLLYELYTVRYLYKRVKEIEDVLPQ